MHRLVLLAAALVLAFAACGGDDDDQATPPTTTVSGSTSTEEAPPATTEEQETTTEEEPSGEVITIETATGPVDVSVEVADSQDEREVGLMDRESLPADAGMIFVFQEDNVGGFWMKNTLIPLSIAFAGGDGTILSILDMEPCEADPCEIYDPGVPYRYALEVNQGAFDDWGVGVGDLISVPEM